ncbi:MAG: hypothetical protein SVK08_01725 [Halobacteriota archaeon]|nr:hypothetical protein [Halobacteriota archaeon]
MKTCIVTTREWRQRIDDYNDAAQALLSLLKEKGAPIEGTVQFKADMKNYTWYYYEQNFGFKFGWEEKNDRCKRSIEIQKDSTW